MAHWHEVAQGQTVSSIADQNGFRSYKTIYEHPENAEFRRLRQNPDLIFPGDRIYIPEITPKQVDAATGKRHRFVVASPRKVVRLIVQDFNGRPIRNTPYELRLESKVITGITDDRGLLEQPIPIQAREAKLRVNNYAWSLKIGDLNPVDDTSDAGVSGIQMRLKNLGFDPGPIDGIFGPRTEAAIRAFQKKHPPLSVDGVCGSQTTIRLLEEHGC
jgi:N-acetylmuramoyl-L-alanine amidase